MTTEILKTKLETINKKCESTTKLKLDKLYTDVNYDNSKFCAPSPQVIEALWAALCLPGLPSDLTLACLSGGPGRMPAAVAVTSPKPRLFHYFQLLSNLPSESSSLLSAQSLSQKFLSA